MKPQNFSSEMGQVLRSWGKPDADDHCKCSACTGELAVCNAIRAMDRLDCESIAQILSTLAAKMQKSGFCDADIEMIDEASGFVCGVI